MQKVADMADTYICAISSMADTYICAISSKVVIRPYQIALHLCINKCDEITTTISSKILFVYRAI